MHHIQTITYSNNGPLPVRLFIMMVEYLTGRLWLEKNYWQSLKKHDEIIKDQPDYPYFNLALDWLGIDIDYDEAQLAKIPSQGPLIVVCNHPFGILDGLAINHLLYNVRKDYRILTNEVLLKAERVKPWLIPIDDSNTPAGRAKNKSSILQALRLLRKESGCICIFSAGRLARVKKWGGRAVDLDWPPLTGHLIKKAADVSPAIVPVFFEGQNSGLFQFACLTGIKAFSRSLVINEIRNKRGWKVKVRIGDPLCADDLPLDKDAEEISAHLRDITMNLHRDD